MLKIGLITIHNIINYGSALQAFATQKFLVKNGCECIIINYQFPTLWHRYKYVKSLGIVKGIRFIIHLLKIRFTKRFWIDRKNFDNFKNNNLVLTKKYYFSGQLKKESSKYNLYIAGSDQIWNPSTTFGDSAFFLGFVKGNLPKIAYSSSISNDSIPCNLRVKYQRHLNKFNSIGVREQTAMKLIREMNCSSIPLQLVCDPTFLLEASDYVQLINQSKLILDSDYILVYALNYSFDPNPALNIAISEAVEQYKCKVIVFSNHIDYEGPTIFMKDVSPEDFIKLFAGAKFVITSSFHGVAFSIIFRKKFLAISPRSGDVRIIDIMNELSLLDNVRYNDETVFRPNFDYPYTKLVESRIINLRNTSIDFLMSNINLYYDGKNN